MKKMLLLFVLCIFIHGLRAENGYRLWLRYDKITDAGLLHSYRQHISHVVVAGSSATMEAVRNELAEGLQGLLDQKIIIQSVFSGTPGMVAATPASMPWIKDAVSAEDLRKAGTEGFVIATVSRAGKENIIITANTDAGVLYGMFHFLRLLQTHQPITALHIVSAPKIQVRILDHWDNLNRSVERGYAGISIWNWHKLPGYIDPRYTDYARANASIGINGAVVTNVNANALSLTKDYLLKAAAIAQALKPYHIRLYLTARFSAPIETGKLKTADPADSSVQRWWREKIREIYTYIPDFGGLLIKANSEGQPGPQTYGRTHADGANMLADALAPYNGIVMWRAFVYSSTSTDRFRQAYDEFKPLDGSFRSNVLVQVKNGPIDFQPREPFSPLFGAMPHTPLALEFQLTQEYLGFSTHLVFEAPLFKECLDADTYSNGKGSTVARVIDGSLNHQSISALAGVANIGNEVNWCGHPFAQANWYSFGRLCWDHTLSSAQLADEWIRQTFSNELPFVEAVKNMMLGSRETMVHYMTPLGLHHIMGYNNHYGPAPWFDRASRADWNPVYFHKADSLGIGFDRTEKGSNALEQYAPAVRNIWANRTTCDDKFVLWFHHVGWQETLHSGNTLWNQLCYDYYQGVDSVRQMQRTWERMKQYIDNERFEEVKMLLGIQETEAVWWRNACVLYFQTFSRKPIPAGLEKPDHTLEYYKSLQFPFAPGNANNN